jgi:hypothetical protein
MLTVADWVFVVHPAVDVHLCATAQEGRCSRVSDGTMRHQFLICRIGPSFLPASTRSLESSDFDSLASFGGRSGFLSQFGIRSTLNLRCTLVMA